VDGERDLPTRYRFQVVVENGPLRRIVPGRYVRRKGGLLVVVPAPSNRIPRLKQVRVTGCYLRSELPQRRDIVQNPERASKGCDYQVITADRQITHRCRGQIQLERVPM